MANEFYSVDVSGVFDKGIRHYTRTYTLFTNDTTLGPGQICALITGEVLYQGWSHGTETDPWALLKKKSAKQLSGQDGGFLWQVTCEYDSEPFERTAGGIDPGSGGTGNAGAGPTDNSQTQPDLRPYSVEMGSVKTTRILRKDVATFVEVHNSAGQLYDPPIEVPCCHPTLRIKLWKAIDDDELSNIPLYVDKINDDTWQGFAAGIVRCTDYTLTSVFEQNAWWWEKVVSFEIQDEGWNPVKILDAGTTRAVTGKPPQPILDQSGNPITSPTLLDGSGQPLLSAGTPVFRDYNAYYEVDFDNIL